jgi:hypothetical protein
MAFLAFFELLAVRVDCHDLVKMDLVLEVVVKLEAFERLEHLLSCLLHHAY